MNAVDYQGQTTLITGASAGLGAEFARRLAARGSDLVLVARRKDRLERLAEALSTEHGVMVTAIAADLSLPHAGQTLLEETDRLGLRVTSLINNAGFGTYGAFHLEDADRLGDEITVNVASVVSISRAYIERLRQAGIGILINVASNAAYQPNPLLAVYGATRAFVLNFTEALWFESAGTGLKVLALSPGPTQTEFFDVIGTTNASGNTVLQTPRQVVEKALHTLDRRNPPPSIISGRRNHLQALSVRLLTRRRAALTVGAMMKPAN
ncbi:SDR family NAD(P)-dependent oxidoreductase [Streptomyces sp. KAU_LT]|uniref:SDR family NAD(P)-dependent oxidoreductase n=1 Tax=Streptomyces sp. KAU_LT TaxID=3046669 RepID=UPI0024B817EE|nr:SDR family NAD(P)-dependent oxidoreductase [Streptomyces sp. KAU_LT]MDI9834976.1 SDR family NAD(P)-dependent oxidoreductase [Streptomyces sp. KAU_LT]